MQYDKILLGTQEWEISPGVTLTKGYSFGTLSARMTLSYAPMDQSLDFGEYAVEYVKKVSDAWRFVLAFEGEQDAQSVIGEAQYTLGKKAVLKVNSAIGVTKKAPDIATEIGVIFSF